MMGAMEVFLPARFIEVVGTIAVATWSWFNLDPCAGGLPHETYDLPNGTHRHHATAEVARSDVPNDQSIGGSLDDIRHSSLRPAVCQRCGQAMDVNASVSMAWRTRYNTASGSAEPGDLFFRPMHDPGEWCAAGWTNCDGRHLHGITPNGRHWDIDGRATNCTLPHDKEHRCWVRHGNPNRGEKVYVDKAGLTCAAGAGSIVVPGWHGFLRPQGWTAC